MILISCESDENKGERLAISHCSSCHYILSLVCFPKMFGKHPCFQEWVCSLDYIRMIFKWMFLRMTSLLF